MELSLVDYELTRLLRESSQSRSFEAVARRDGREVIAKVFDIGDDGTEARVEHEFELISGLDIDGVVRAEALRRVGDHLVLILARAPGVDLQRLCEGTALELERFWPIAAQVAEILAQTHARRVIHRDIKPANLLFDPDSGKVHIADFGISVLLESERRQLYDDTVLMGTLPYISPEQTGRTMRSVDFRSDLYSLGVTFYELLTGERPFDSSAPLDLIHAHLARTPAPPKQLRPTLPEALSRLVMKLMAKAPEHRYQTAAGLSADLGKLQSLHEQGLDDSEFELGSEDGTGVLQLPQQLYGHERVGLELREEFEALVTSRSRRTTLLMGRAGIGKSALLGRLEVAALAHGGYVLRGKFDANQERPYLAFVEAFTGLFEQLLTESDARLGRWRLRLREGLGALSQVVCELVPTATVLLGAQPTPAKLGPIEARNRLRVAIERLVACLSSEAPLVFILDELHEADHGSVGLLDALSRASEGPVLISGTLREAELDEGHPLRALLRECGRDSLPHARVIELLPLDAEATAAMLRDALGLGEDDQAFEDLSTFAAIVARKTGGVPLFLRQLLTQLIGGGQLRREHKRWRWDRSEVEAAQLPDDAVEMMRARLETLGPEARELLGRAACLGTRFGLTRLARASGVEPGELVGRSFELIEAGLLIAVGNEYRFSHTSIRAAAERVLSAAQLREVHWRIGSQMLAERSDEQLSDEQLFELVEHLSAGMPDEVEASTRLEIAELGCRAGQRALDTAAYDLARHHFDQGLALLGDQQGQAALRFELQFGRAQALALVNQRQLADEAFAGLLGGELGDEQFGLVMARRLRLLQFDNRQVEAVALGREALVRLGAPLPNKVSTLRALWALTRAWLQIRKLDRETLMAMPACVDPRCTAIVEIVAQLKYPAFVVDNDLFLYLSGLHILLLREYGFHETSPVAIGDFALSASGGFNLPAEGVRLISLALDSCSRSSRPLAMRANILAIGGALCWHRGLAYAEFLDELARGYDEALEVGEIDHAAFISTFDLDMRLDIGMHLAVLERRSRELELELGRRGAKQMEVYTAVVNFTCAGLLGRRAPEHEASGARRLADLTNEYVLCRGGVETSVISARASAAFGYFVLGERERAVELSLAVFGDVAEVLFNSWLVARVYLVGCAGVWAQLSFGETPPAGAEAMAAKSFKLLDSWAKGCPENYGHYRDLARGMRAASAGRHEQALELLDQAWLGARESGCRFVEGLAAEYTAMLLERAGKGVLTEGAWRRAWEAFAAWGAEAKLEGLRSDKPTMFAEPERRRISTPASALGHVARSSTSQIGHTPGPRLDLEQILHSVGGITEGLELGQVIEQVLEAALTNAGADHALLFLERNGEVTFAARSSAHDEGCEVFARARRLREVGPEAPSAVINFVVRTGQQLVIDDVGADSRFAGDSYLSHHGVCSLIALPLVKNELVGILVLENRLSTGTFTPAIIETLELIVSQASSTLDNARLHAALHRSEVRWRSLVDGAPDLIALLDERGRLLFVNRGEVDEEGEAEFTRSMSEDSRARWDAAVNQVLDGGFAIELELEHRASADSFGPRWSAARIAPIELDEDPGESLARIRRSAVVIATDVSDRKRAESEREELEAQLRQQQRLESLGILASGVAHEINNPVQGIMSYAELIAAEIDDRDTVLEFASEIAHETERVATIVRNLLHFSRQEKQQDFERVMVPKLIDGTLSLIRAVLRHDQIKLEVDLGELEVRCRVQQIQQIIMNLVTNARDAVNERFPGYDERKRIAILCCSVGGKVRITVEDTGGGIPDHVLGHIFDPFFTTKGRDKGTGLGLAVSHGIAEEHGGELSVETELGEGTRFHLDLPRT